MFKQQRFNYCNNLDPELFCTCRGENLRVHFQTPGVESVTALEIEAQATHAVWAQGLFDQHTASRENTVLV